MHQDADAGHGLCTVYGCRVVVFAVGPRSSAVTWSSRRPCDRQHASSDLRTPAPRRPRRSASAAPRSTGGSCRTSRRSRCRGERRWSRSTSSSDSSPSVAGQHASGYAPLFLGGRRSSRPTSSTRSAPGASRGGPSRGSRATSTPTEHRPRTAVRSGGLRPCAPSSGAAPRPRLGRGLRHERVAPGHDRLRRRRGRLGRRLDPEVRGAHNQGRTREETRANVIDALRGILELRFGGRPE